jgi:hypothetical protein
MTIEEVVKQVLLDEQADVLRAAVEAVCAELMEIELVRHEALSDWARYETLPGTQRATTSTARARARAGPFANRFPSFQGEYGRTTRSEGGDAGQGQQPTDRQRKLDGVIHVTARNPACGGLGRAGLIRRRGVRRSHAPTLSRPLTGRERAVLPCARSGGSLGAF